MTTRTINHLKFLISQQLLRVDHKEKEGAVPFILEIEILYTIIPTPSNEEYLKIFITLNNFECDIIFVYNPYLIELVLLNSIINKCNKNMIFFGDFNSHNPLWGSKNINKSGKNVEHFKLNNLYLLNDGSPTLINLGNGALSCLDRTLSTPSLAFKWPCAVFNTTLGSDRFTHLQKFGKRLNP